MTDGVTTNPGTGGAKIDTEDLGARGHLQRIKLVKGALDADGGDWDDGTDITSPSAMPAGGVGIRGWLSAIYTQLKSGASAVSLIDGADVTQGLKADVAYTDATGQASGTVSSVVKGLFVKLSNVLKVDIVVQAASTDRGAVIGFTGAQVTTNATAQVTVTVAPTSGTIQIGHVFVCSGFPAGTTVLSFASGTGGVGSVVNLSAASGTSGTGVISTSVGPQQIAPINLTRRGLAYQNQNALGNIWINGITAVSADYRSLKITPGSYYENPPGHVGTGAISVMSDTPALPLYAREI